MVIRGASSAGQVPSFRSTEAVFAEPLAVAASGRPSPLKSPTATAIAAGVGARLIGGVKVPGPRPSSTLRVPSPQLAVNQSALPSPLKSPTPADAGVSP